MASLKASGGEYSSSKSKLVVNAVSKEYAGTTVLRSIDMDVADGEFVSIVGASGCGKTTLLRIIAGLQSPTTGSVLVDDRTITGPSPKVAVAFQSDRLFPWRTVGQNVALGWELTGSRPTRQNLTVQGLLELVGLGDFERRYPYQLSGGMKQRVNLARALAIDPELFLLDEPFAALDAQTREVMQVELLRIWRETQKTAVFITHQIDEAVFLSDRVFVLSRRPGQVREVVHVGLPRPRDLSVKRSVQFNGLVERIWALLEGDIVASGSEDESS